MKYAAFSLLNDPQKTRVGAISSDGKMINELGFDMDLSEQGIVAIIRADLENTLPKPIATHNFNSIRLLAPVPRPRRNIFCVGKNYHEHAKEFSSSGFDGSAKPGEDIPSHAIFFTKPPESVTGPDTNVVIPSMVSSAIDYEAELTVIIGRGGKGISEADAMKHVWGYTAINDVTARDWQQRHKQWFLGKSFDTFCPMGPWVVTANEVDVNNISVKCWVNGELRQNSNSKDLIFNIPNLIATVSAGITLYPGDIIATGTPVGVGIGFKPPKYLIDGDVVKVEMGGIGSLENTFVVG